jgi:hypothetical protein
VAVLELEDGVAGDLVDGDLLDVELDVGVAEGIAGGVVVGNAVAVVVDAIAELGRGGDALGLDLGMAYIL